MNPVQEFFMKAQNAGSVATIQQLEQKLRVAEAARLKAENENAELKQTLANMQMMKEKYQTVVIDVMATLERHGLVS